MNLLIIVQFTVLQDDHHFLLFIIYVIHILDLINLSQASELNIAATHMARQAQIQLEVKQRLEQISAKNKTFADRHIKK